MRTVLPKCQADHFPYVDGCGLTNAGRSELIGRIRAGFMANRREVMVVCFPAEFCTDGGQSINTEMPDWQVTLPRGAQIFLDFWRNTLQPGGFGFSARLLISRVGAPCNVGLFVTWPQPEHIPRNRTGTLPLVEGIAGSRLFSVARNRARTLRAKLCRILALPGYF